MKLFLSHNKLFFVVVLIFIVAEIIVNPLGNFPLIDDWSFAQAVIVLDNTGVVNPGNYPAMTLYTQIAWGYLVTKIFGFSFFVLRFSSLISAVLGLAFLNKLVGQISGNKKMAALACLVIMFNPMVFCLTNTFMTDINFNTLVIMCCYYMYNFFTTKKILYYIGFVVSCILLVMLRQYGLIAPACFIFSCFFVKQGRIQNIILAVICFIVVYTLLKIYEEHLRALLRQDSMFKFSGDIHLSDTVFWNKLLLSAQTKYREVMRHILLYTMPFAAIFLPKLVRAAGLKIGLFALIVAVFITWVLYGLESLVSGSIFSSMILGTETFYESFAGRQHNVYPRFDEFMQYIKIVSTLITTFVLTSGLALAIMKNKWRSAFKPESVFLIAMVFTYAFMIFITESYFDRYHIPVITVMVILTAYLGRQYEFNLKPAVVPLLFWAYVSVAGTKDYLTWNRVKWNAYSYLCNELKVPFPTINAGLEVNCWHEGILPGWWDFMRLDIYDYLVQFNKEEGFVPIKEYEFQRYFPYTKDRIYILMKEGAKK